MKRFHCLRIPFAVLMTFIGAELARADHFSFSQGYSRSDYGYRGPSNFDYGASRFGSSYPGTFYNGTLYRGPAGADFGTFSSYRGPTFSSPWNSTWDYHAYRGYGIPNIHHDPPGQWNQWNHCTPFQGNSTHGHPGFRGTAPELGIFPR